MDWPRGMSAEIWLKAHEIARAEIDRIRSGTWGGGHEPNPGLAASIANFAIAAVKAEREECAKVADDRSAMLIRRRNSNNE